MRPVTAFGELTTSYTRPWMLIFRGGQLAGQGPRTVLAWCHEAIAQNNHINAYRVTVIRGNRLCLRTVTILPHEIAWAFAQRPFLKPTAQAIRKAKKHLAATSL